MAKDIVFLRGPVSPSGRVYSNILKTDGYGWDMVVERPGVPLLDSEINLMQQITRTKVENFIAAFSLPGWIKPSGYPLSSASDLSLDNSSRRLQLPDDSWFIGNGHVLHIRDTRVGSGGVQISLPTKPGTGTTRTDFVFLEFWRHEVSPTPTSTYHTGSDADATVAETGYRSTTRDQVYVEGGVDNSTQPNDLLGIVSGAVGNPYLGTFGETSRRIQVRWRVRIVQGVDFGAYGYGLGTNLGATNPSVIAQAGLDVPVSGYTFAEVSPFEEFGTIANPNDMEVYGKGRLWRSGDGSLQAAKDLNTVDGYVYAVPMFRINMSDSGVANTGFVDAVDMRQLSHVFLPNRVLHSDMLCTYDDPAQPGVYGGAYEIITDPIYGGTHKSNIRRQSITGGIAGDIALNTITGDNIQNNSILGDLIQNNSLTLNHMNIDATGLPSVKAENRTGATATNGMVVVLERGAGTWNGFSLANNSNSTNAATIGVVANYDSLGVEANIPNGQLGFVRLYGQVAKINVDGTVARGQFLSVSSATPGNASVSTGAGDIFGFVLDNGTGQARALLFQRVPTNAVKTSQIVDGAVTTSKLNDQAVTTAKIGPRAVGGPQIGLAAIIGENIAPGAVGELQINAGAVTNTKIGFEAIQYINIAAGAITDPKIGDQQVNTRAIANTAVTGIKIAPNSIGNGHITPSAVQRLQIADGSIGPNQIEAGTIQTVHLTQYCVVTNNITPSAITTATIQDRAVTSTKIGLGQVISENIADANITSPKILNQAVVSAKIADNNVLAQHILASAIQDQHKGVPYYVEIQRNATFTVPDSTLTIVSFTDLAMDTPSTTYAFPASWAAGAPTLYGIRRRGLYFVQMILHLNGSSNVWYVQGSVSSPGNPQPYVVVGDYVYSTGQPIGGGPVVHFMPWNIVALEASTTLQLQVMVNTNPAGGNATFVKAGVKLLRIGDF